MNETQSLVTLVPWTFIAQILNLFIQLFLIKKFLLKPINNILKKRQELADKEIRDAKTAKEEAIEMKNSYESSISEARDEAARIMKSAEKEASAKAEAIVSEAKDEAAGIKQRAEADIAQERKKALNEVKDEIGGLAMDIAGKVVEKEIREEDHKKLIEDFIRGVREAS